MQKRYLRIKALSGIVIFVTGTIVSALAGTIKHEPNFYRLSHVPPSDERKQAATKFLNNFVQMGINIKERKEKWGCDAPESEINSFFQEAFIHLGEAESLSKVGISSPSLTVEDDHVRMAFRYGKGWFSTIISYELRVWLVPKEANVVAVQALSARAGALPIPAQSILHQLLEFAGKQNFKTTLYRHEGTPVAIIRLQDDPSNPTSTLTMLEFAAHRLVIRGITLEHALPPPMVNIKDKSLATSVLP